MIVVDTNVIAYLFVPGDRTSEAINVLRSDPDWAAPLLWRSEFRNVLATYMRVFGLAYPHALRVMEEAERLMQGAEYQVPSPLVFSLANESGLSSYDCEFVALAHELNTSLVTSDQKVLSAFPDTAVPLSDFAEQPEQVR